MTRALFVFTPAESKRLIGKAIAQMKEVRHALKNANLIIAHGTTNICVAEEILGKEKFAELMGSITFVAGIVKRGLLCASTPKGKPPIVLLKKGVLTPPPATMSELLSDFQSDSVFIKGASAIDAEGNAAVMVSHPEGGTIGWAIGTIMARGIRLIVPVGLEKLVPSVKQAIAMCGQNTLDYCQGMRVGLVALSNAIPVTEIEALKMLAGVDACQVASGGLDGSEGSVQIVAEGEQTDIAKAIEIVESIKNEPPIHIIENCCEDCNKCAPGIMEKFGRHR